MNVVCIKDLSVYYDNVCALEKINFNCDKLDFIGLIGPNGGGKSTLIKIIVGLIKPKKVHVDIRGKIGYVPQFKSFDRDFPIDVIKVILMGTLKKNISIINKYSKKDVSKARIIMNKLNILELEKRQIGQLSGGQLQRVLIARALMSNPDILVLDEPAASLDEDGKEYIYKMLKKLNEEKTIIVVSHDMNHILNYAHKVFYIDKNIHIDKCRGV